MTGRCIMPRCNARAVHEHHLVFRQHVTRAGGDLTDPRNLVPMCFRCHERHHSRIAPIPAWVLPDAVFEFASELLGAGAAYEYLRRKHGGGDPRLEALVA